MTLTKAKFAAVERLFEELHMDEWRNAQGDSVYDTQVRREQYRKKLEKMLTRKKK